MHETASRQRSIETMAAHGFEFLNRMWGADYSENTALYMMADTNGANGRIGNKRGYVVYANAFAMYAAAAYYELSGDPNAPSPALDTFDFLEAYAHDETYGGYFVAAGSVVKDANVNMHVIEGLYELYRALPLGHAKQAQVAARARELVDHFLALLR